MRALAVLADHAGVPGLSGGFVGGDVFFVLSGFLITSLLLDEHRRTGRVDLRRSGHGTLAGCCRADGPGHHGDIRTAPLRAGLGRRPELRRPLGTRLGRELELRRSEDGLLRPGRCRVPLQHTWSLGVEEQYYLVWPLVLTAVTVLLAHRSRASVQRLATLATVGAFATVGGALPATGAFRDLAARIGRGARLSRPDARRAAERRGWLA